MDEPLLAVGQLFYTLDGVVQRIAEQRTQVHRIHKIQRRTVCHAGQRDAVLLAVQAFAGQDRVQHLVAGLVLRLIAADLLLHRVEVLGLFL